MRAILYGGSRLPFRTPRDKITPSATQIAQTTVNPRYNAHSESEIKKLILFIIEIIYLFWS